jgi:hypothetical protein
MLPTEAAKLLDLPLDATPEQLEARFLELRARLEDKIAKAPTPGLKAKYRESLEQITTAFESLTLAADGSALPVIQKQSAGSGQPSVGGPASPRAATPVPSTPALKKKSGGGKEFIIVALIAVAVLGAGGWWVMQLRAEKAAAAAEAVRQKQAEDARAAADAKTASQLRTQLATAKVAWEAMENRLREAERQTSEAKSESRSFRDGPAWKKAELSAMAQRHEMFSNWLNEYLANHPAKVSRATAEQLLGDKLTTEAAEAVTVLNRSIDEMQHYIRARADQMLEGTVKMKIESQPAGVKFVYTDAYGRTNEGVTPATLVDQPLSHLHNPKFDGSTGGDTRIQVGEFTVTPSVRFIRPGWKDVVKSERPSVDLGEATSFSAEFPEGTLEIASKPAGLNFTVTQPADLGWTATGIAPAVLTRVPVGKIQVTVERPGYGKARQNLEITANTASRTVELGNESQEVNIAVAEPAAKIFVDKKFVSRGQARVLDLVPGEHALQIEADGYLPYRTKFAVAVSSDKLPVLRYSIKELAVENINCTACGASGAIDRTETCLECNGRGWVQCLHCGGEGYLWVDGGLLAGGSKQRCTVCNGTRRAKCGWEYAAESRCSNGTVHRRDPCKSCGGDGRVSQLQLSQSL